MKTLRLSELRRELESKGLGLQLEGADVAVSWVNTLQDAGEGELSFLSNPKYHSQLAQTRASAVVVGEDVAAPPGLPLLRCRDPYTAITYAIVSICGHREHPQWGIHPKAHVEPSAEVGEGANIAPGAHVEAGAVLGRNCTLYPGTYVGQGARLGDGCILYPNVVVYEGCVLGERCTVHSGSVIGQDGLGYAKVEGKWVKIPQVGRVHIGDDVEIGANCAIDRATLGWTTVGSGTKLGNGNIFGHGDKVGDDCLFVGQVGLSGSVTVGDRVTFAGQVGSVGHIEIGDDASIGGQSMVLDPVPPGAKVLGSPAQPIVAQLRAVAAQKRLPELLNAVKELRREVAELRAAQAE